MVRVDAADGGAWFRPRSWSLATRTVLAMTLAALLPVGLIGTVAVAVQRASLTERLVGDLEEVAALQQLTLARFAAGTAEHARLTAARTQVRTDLAGLLADPDADRSWLEAALPETVDAVAELRAISLTDLDGTPVATTPAAPPGPFEEVVELLGRPARSVTACRTTPRHGCWSAR